MSVGAVNKQTGERIPTAGMPAVDSVLSGSSTNPVQNRVVKAALDEKVDAVSGKGLSTNDYSNTDKAKVDASLNVFTGTQAEWAALSTAEKKTYQRADFTDDYDNTAIGDLTALHTSAKSSIVNAINEVADGKQNSTDNSLQTTDKTIVGGINEVKSGLINKTDYREVNIPSDLSTINDAINYLMDHINTVGSGVYAGAWISHDYYMCVAYTFSDNVLAMVTYGTNNSKIYNVSWSRNSYNRVNEVMYTA